MKKIIIFFICALAFANESTAQIGLGTTAGIDLYQYHRVPNHPGPQGHSTGSALANFNFGPKLWIGGSTFSISAEGAISFAPFALDVNDYKGLGAVSFPISVDLNFGGLTGFSPKAKQGFSIGAGMSYHRMELYFTDDDYADSRQSGFYSLYFGQVAYGFGSGGTDVKVYVRYGYGEEDSKYFSAGINRSINYFTGKKEAIGE